MAPGSLYPPLHSWPVVVDDAIAAVASLQVRVEAIGSRDRRPLVLSQAEYDALLAEMHGLPKYDPEAE